MLNRESLYRLVIGRLDGDKTNDALYRKKIFGLVEKGIAGFILFGGEKEKIKPFLREIQQAAHLPLFIASDIERGAGKQIKGTTAFPCQMAMAAAVNKKSRKSISLLEGALNAIADEALDIGINMPLIPVLDVNQNMDNPIISTRAFSDNPEDVAWFGARYIKILQEKGLICSGKHFPGHGDTAMDSHIGLPVIKKSHQKLLKEDLLPFIKAIKAGVKSVMVGHLLVPSIDSNPATISKKIITGLLREEFGFRGLILTDALNMGALRNIRDVHIKCLKAGADILLHPSNPETAVRELMAGVESGKISEEEIDVHLRRILKARKKLGQNKKLSVNYKAHEAISMQLTEMSITKVKGKNGIIPINKNKAHLILAGDKELFKDSILKDYFKNASEIKKTKTFKADVAVFAIFTSPSAWKGTSGIDEKERDRIIKLIKKAKNSIVISFGSPYVLRHFDGADMFIASYEESGNAQRAVMKCLKGDMDFKGRLPVSLKIRKTYAR